MGLKWLTMYQLGRIGTANKFMTSQQHLLMNQQNLFEDTQRMNIGKRRLTAYEDPAATLTSQILTSRIDRNAHLDEIRSAAKSELEVAESSLSGIQEIVSKMKQDALMGVNATMGAQERLALADQVRNQGLNIIQLLNSKVANKYIFSGVSTNQKTATLQEGADFSAAVHRGGDGSISERFVAGLQTSVNLTEFLTAEAASASITGTNFNPVATGQLRLVVDDGNGNIIDTGNVTFAGSNIATIVTRINNAYTAAGGSGAIARQQPAGYLNLDTSLITGNSKNNQARITVKAGTAVGTALSNTGLTIGTYRGVDGNIMDTISKLEAGYRLNDTTIINNAQRDLESNISRILSKRAELGHLSKRVETQINLEDEQKMDLTIQRSDNDDIPVAEAINAITKAQNALNSSMDAASLLLGQTVFDFLDFL